MLRGATDKLVLPGLCIVATSYGLGRYAYGLFLPLFREEFQLSDSSLAFIAAISYAAYFVVTVAAMLAARHLQPRHSVLLGGLSATTGMALIATAETPIALAAGAALAAISPGLAYTPFSEIIQAMVAPQRRNRVYSIINSGTALGVMLSGPLAICFGQSWRGAWLLFALFALVSTIWCVSVVPRFEVRVTDGAPRGKLLDIVAGERGRLMLVAFLLGIGASVYWTFSVELARTNVPRGMSMGSRPLDAIAFAQLFWTFVGLASFAGVLAGSIIARIATMRALGLFIILNSLAFILIAYGHSASVIVLSGILFGATGCLYCAALGIWSMDLFADMPTTGFGATFLSLSAGQFVGPLAVGIFLGSADLATLFAYASILSLVVSLLLPRRGRSPIDVAAS